MLPAKLAEANSADAAIKQAQGAGDLAVWSKEKILLQGVGSVARTQPGNRGRDLAQHLHRRGFMLNVRISWLKNALWFRY